MNKKVILCLLLLFVTTGCTKQLKGEDNKVVTYDLTGQSLTENILCQPNDEDLIQIYLENDIDVYSLPTCTDFTINSGSYEGIWNTLFIKPLAFVIIKMGELVNNYGLAIMLLGVLIRVLLIPITKKTAMQSENLKLARPELDKLEVKYASKTSQEEQIMKSQEMMGVYKKYNINPLSGCLFALIQLPLFIAFLEAINRIPAVFENNFLTLHLGTTPLRGVADGNLLYLLLVVLIGLATHYSFKLNATAVSDEATMPQMKYMQIGMVIMIVVSAFNFSSAIALYWISTSTFTICQNLIVKKQKEKNIITKKK